MKQFILTVKNMIKLRSFNTNLYRFLYKECDVNIIRTSMVDKAWIYWFNDGSIREIMIGKMRNREEVISALLHEVGHYKDIKKLGPVRFKRMPMKEQERSAWKWAIKFSKQYDLEMDYQISVEWLGTYKASYRCLENLASNQSR